MLTVPAQFDHRRWRLIGVGAMIAYLVWTHLMMGLRGEHWLIAVTFIALFGASRPSAYFGYLVLPFLAVGIGYDNLRLFMHLRPEVHVADLYHAELTLFGLPTDEGRVIPPLFFATRNHPVLDVVTGITYILYLLETFALGAYLIFADRSRLPLVTWGFFFVNLMGWITWIVFPAAPPWYVAEHGLGPANMAAASSAAGAARFDAVLGVTLFHDFYARSSNVFGAMPSLHCAYPTLCALVAWGHSRRLGFACIAFALLMYFSAVYLQHHYVLDVIAGITYSTAVFLGMVTWRRMRSAEPLGLSDAGASAKATGG